MMGDLQQKLAEALHIDAEAYVTEVKNKNSGSKNKVNKTNHQKNRNQKKNTFNGYNPNDINTFVWKGAKRMDEQKNKIVQDKIYLVDATPEQLKEFHNYCKTMLFNNDKKNLGRVHLLKEIEDARQRCGVELFYRDAIKDGSSRFSIVNSLKTAVKNKELNASQIDDLLLSNLITVHPDYYNLPYKTVIEGGTHCLGRFDRKHISLTFILSHGVWLSDDEILTFNQPDLKSKLNAIKEYLKLPDNYELKVNSQTGLSVKQIKSMITLKKVVKYEDMTDEQLRTLRYKLLFFLDDQINYHISQWNSRIEQIKLVAKHRNIDL